MMALLQFGAVLYEICTGKLSRGWRQNLTGKLNTQSTYFHASRTSTHNTLLAMKFWDNVSQGTVESDIIIGGRHHKFISTSKYTLYSSAFVKDRIRLLNWPCLLCSQIDRGSGTCGSGTTYRCLPLIRL